MSVPLNVSKQNGTIRLQAQCFWWLAKGAQMPALKKKQAMISLQGMADNG